MRRFTLLTLLSSGLLIGGIGCSGGKSDYKKPSELTKAPPAHDHGHDHGHEKGPHGGSLVELGKEEFHAEVLVDHDAHSLKVFVLGKDAKSAVPTSAKEVTLTAGKETWTLKAAPQKTDGEGKSSVFELVDHDVIHAILDSKAIHGKVRVMIDDKPFLGDVDYHLEDAHHDHKDEPEKGHKDEAKPEEKKDPAADKDKPVEAAKEPEAK